MKKRTLRVIRPKWYSPNIDEGVIKIIMSGNVSKDPDIFAEAGLKNPDLSILSEEFLDKMSGKENENLQIELLRKLLNDEIRVKQKK